jgi:hypothetical protein
MLSCRLKNEDPFVVNDVFTSVWNFMGLYPLLYAAILIPGARSNKVRQPQQCSAVSKQGCITSNSRVHAKHNRLFSSQEHAPTR